MSTCMQMGLLRSLGGGGGFECRSLEYCELSELNAQLSSLLSVQAKRCVFFGYLVSASLLIICGRADIRLLS